MKKAIIMLSGGMDSCVTTSISINHGYKPYLLHVNYGQRTQRRELKSFHDIANFYNIEEKLIVDITHLSKIGGSCLIDEKIDVPKANLENKEVPISYVPFRNANILSIATSWAEIINASAIYVGAVEEDSSGYPDCRRSFFDAFESVINTGTKPDTNIKIITPLISLSKKEIINKGLLIGSPLEMTWSCYKNSEKPCNECDSCILREKGFKGAGHIDPIN